MIQIDKYIASTYIIHSKVKSHKDVSLPLITPPSNVIHLHKWKDNKQSHNLYTPTCI